MLSVAGPTTWEMKSATRSDRSSCSAWWRDLLRAMYRGESRHPVMIALSETVERYRIPIEPFELLISAFEQDQTVSEYQTYEAVARLLQAVGQPGRTPGPSCRRGVHARKRAPFRCDLHCASAREFLAGRRSRPGDRPDLFAARRSGRDSAVFYRTCGPELFTPAFARLMEFEVGRTRALFAEGRALIARLPREIAIDVDLFSRGGLAILDAIEARGFDVLSARPRLSRWTKVRLVARAALAQRMASITGLGFGNVRRTGADGGTHDAADALPLAPPLAAARSRMEDPW